MRLPAHNKVEDLRPQGAGWQVQLHEKGGKQHAMPCHHALAEALRAYIASAKGFALKCKSPLDQSLLIGAESQAVCADSSARR